MSWIKKEWDRYYNMLSNRGIFWFSLLCSGLVALVVWLKPSVFSLGIALVSLQFAGVFWKALLRSEYALLSMVSKPLAWLISTFVFFIFFVVIITPIRAIRRYPYSAKWYGSSATVNKMKMYE